MFMWIIKRDLLLYMRRQSYVLTTLVFFICLVILFPLIKWRDVSFGDHHVHDPIQFMKLNL